MTSTAPNGGLHPDIDLPHTDPLELYHNAFSLCSTQVRVCLAERQLKYKSNHIHLIETGWYESCGPAFKRINPGARKFNLFWLLYCFDSRHNKQARRCLF